jgi:drug/metabolite transporter (DMT)-like permease
MVTVDAFLLGIATAACWAIALVFLRTWHTRRDRFFLLFSLAFWMLSLTWVSVAVLAPEPETRHYFYVFRLIAFALIIAAIVERNRRQ